MKTKVSPAIVGAFVVGAFALGIVALLTFGGINFFTKPQRFMVYFDESISGLDPGAPVKLRGVRVGRVVALNIRYDETTNQSVVAVVCEFNKDVVTDNRGGVIDVADRAELQTLVDRGLRAQLGIAGLATGLLFVQLDFFDPRDYPAREAPKDGKYAVVPAATSISSEIQASVSDILASLKDVDFAGLSRGLNGLIADTRRQLDGLDLKRALDQWTRTGAQLEALVSNPEIRRTLENVGAAVVELRVTIAKIDQQVEPTGTELRETLVAAQKTIETLNATTSAAGQFLNNNSGVGEELVETMRHLNETADAVKRLAEFLERNPNALLTGRRPPR